MVAGFKAGFNVKLTQTPRRRPKLTEAEATLGELAKRFTDFRTTGAAFNTVAVSGIFTATQKEWACSLVESQLLDPEAEPDPALFMCTSFGSSSFYGPGAICPVAVAPMHPSTCQKMQITKLKGVLCSRFASWSTSTTFPQHMCTCLIRLL